MSCKPCVSALRKHRSSPPSTPRIARCTQRLVEEVASSKSSTGCWKNSSSVSATFSETLIEEEKKKQERIELRQKQYNVHKSVEFNSAMIKPAQKFEYPFLGTEEVYTYSFLLAEDPYDSTKDERLRAKWIQEAQMLFGEFKP